MIILGLFAAHADPLTLERGRYALTDDKALTAREQALRLIEADRGDWRGWHLYLSACQVLRMGTLCKADLELAAETLPPVDIVNTWFDVQAEAADLVDLEGDDHPELRALATGTLHASPLPEARAAALVDAVQYARDAVEQLSRDALDAHPSHPEIQLALWLEDDPRFEKARARVLKAGKKLKGRDTAELYRWLRVFEAARAHERVAEVRQMLVDAGEDVGDDAPPPAMSMDASFARADARIAEAVVPMHREGALLHVPTRRQLLAGVFRQRLAVHAGSKNPRSRLDEVTSNALAGRPNDPTLLALACETVREAPCGDRPDLAAAYAGRAERRLAAGEREAARVDIVVATLLQPWAPPSWYTLRATTQDDPVAALVSRAIAWELGGDEPEGGLGAGWPGPTEAGAEAAKAAIALWQASVADPAGPPFDRDRAVRTLITDAKDHKELRRMAFLEYLEGNDAEVDALLARFLRTYEEDPMGHVALAVAMRRRGLWSEAEAAYRAAIALEDEHAHAHEDEGARIDTRGTHVHGAEEEITFEPTPPEAWTGLAVVLAHQGRLDEARAMLAHATEHEHTGALLDLHRGLVHEAAGERAQALASLDLALKWREGLSPADLTQLRLVLDEEPLLEELRGEPAFRELMTRSYGRTGL